MIRAYRKDLRGVTNRSGVYIITNTMNGKVYVGSAVSVRGRLQFHRSCLRRCKHENHHLQRAWNKYGEKKFRLETIEECSLSILREREQYWMDTLGAADSATGYNINPVAGGGGMEGRKHTEASRKKMSASRKGQDTSAATAAAALVTLGKTRPAEVRAKISASGRGKKRSQQTKDRIRANHWSNREDAAEIAAKAAETNKRRRRERSGIVHGTTS